MSREEKTASGVATTESGSGKELTRDNNYYIRKQAKKQGIVEKALLKGAENAIPGTDLAKLIGCRSTRYLQRMISIERQNGALILSSSDGYFLPSDGQKGRDELERFVARFRSLALNTLMILKPAKRALSVTNGQMDINTWQNDQV